ncbi:MAG: cobaltochelatase CobN [Methanofollis sp.]|nr:cobaltochelatase CobN [Methanofollis sp.]
MEKNRLKRLYALTIVVVLCVMPAAAIDSSTNITTENQTAPEDAPEIIPEDAPVAVIDEETPHTSPDTNATERHRLAIVAGGPCNLSELNEAALDAPVDVTVLNGTEALLYNFSAERLIFAASVNDAVIKQIAATMDPTAPLVVYDTPAGTELGTLADTSTAARWTEGGTENFRALMIYLDTTSAGNATQTECPDNRTLAIVTGDTARQAAVANVSATASLKIALFNETEAQQHDFAEDSLIFAASDDDTLEQIADTVADNATLLVCEQEGDSTVGTPAGDLLEKYWLYGGEENLFNMVLALENEYYGTNHTLADPLPPGERPKIAYVFSRTSEFSSMRAIAEEKDVQARMNVTVYLGRSNENLSFDLSAQDVVLLSNIDAGVIEDLSNTVEAARDNGATIISMGPLAQSYNLHTLSPESNESKKIEEYLEYPSEHNHRSLALYMGATFCNLTCEAEDPETRPVYGIYHPAAPEIFSSVTAYLDWYAGTGRYDPANPTVGIMTGDYKYFARDGPMLDALIDSFENRSVNVILGTYHYKDPVNIGYFMQNGTVLIDTAIVISKGSRLDYSDPDRGIENLKTLDVPVLNAVRLFYDVNETTWRQSPHGVGPEQTYQLAAAELDGIIEPIVFAGKEPDPVTGELCYKPFEDQTAWLTDRAIGWMNLHRTANADKKVIIPYYCSEAGKAFIGADIDYYLDAQASLANLLAGMKERGYDLGGRAVPDADELADLMVEYGHNYGKWASDELEECVQNGDAILIPEAQYLAWFNELPADKKAEVRDVWGEPPGDIMVYENGGEKFLVIPTIRFGNVMLAPDPMSGLDQDVDVMYRDSSIPPTHQCIAFYLYMDRVYNADAIFSIFSAIPTMPGKECGLACTDWGAILSGDMPHIHVLPMDAEGIFDHRRANMAIVDFMTPTIVPSGLYGDFADLEDAIDNYQTVVDEAVKAQYKSQIIVSVKNLSLDSALDVNASVFVEDDDAFEAFLPDLESYLTSMKTSCMPYGSHTLGEVPEGEPLAAMLKGMIDPDYSEHVAAAGGDDESGLEILCLVVNGTAPADAQADVLGTTTADISNDLALGLDYLDRINGCTVEIPRILDALEARYIPPGPNGDPIRNPDALPTGRNLHTFDDREIPTAAAWNVGTDLGDELIARYIEDHGEYPGKISFLLWSIETSRHQGTMESEIFWMLGVRPVWDSRNRVKDVELIPSSELGRPRVDVLVVCSGSYRDMYASRLELIDKAVRLAAEADDGAMPNYVKINTEDTYQSLIASGYDEETARTLSLARIFCPPPGSYSPGIEHAIGASDTWDNTSAIADYYIDRMGYIYSGGIWGEQYADVFRDNLEDVSACVFSRTSNVYGCLEHPMVAAYFGGLNLAIKEVTGRSVDMYINNLRSAQDQKLETLGEFLSKDLYSRYLNPTWIEGMMGHGYDGSRYFVSLVENTWIWDVTMPDLISEGMWDDIYETYVLDSNNLGLSEFFDEQNPYALQSIEARLLDAARKGYWNPDDGALQQLADDFQRSVDINGVTCCHHTCGNLDLSNYIQGMMKTAAPDGSDDSGGEPPAQVVSESAAKTPSASEDGPSGDHAAANSTATSGYGQNQQMPAAPQIAPPDAGVSGHVMEEMNYENQESGATTIPIIPILIVAIVIGAVFAGIWWKRT